MTEQSLRIAVILNPLTTRRAGGEHAEILSRELLGRGHVVRGFGAWGRLPRSTREATGHGGLLPADGPGLTGFGPDIVVAYDAGSPAALAGARFARSQGRPLLLIEEGQAPGVRLIEPWLRRLGGRLWGAYVRRACARAIALDPLAEERLLDRGFAPESILLLPKGIDLAHYRPGLSSHLPSLHGIRGRTLLYVGPLEAGLGLELLIQAFARTVGRRSDWSLVLAGEGAGRRALRAAATRTGVGTQVHLLPEPREEELPGLFGAGTLYASPGGPECATAADSTNERRALACGLPVIGTARPALRHLVEDDGCGRLVASGELKDWTETLSLASSSPERRRRWSARAREIAEERFAWPRVVGRIDALLREIVDEGRRSPANEAVPQPEAG